MTKSRWTPLFLAILFVSTFAAEDSRAVELPKAVTAEIDLRIADKKLVGMVIGTVDAGGVDYHAFGETMADNGTVPDEHTVFEIGSITKVFTGILLADAVNRGEVNFTDTIDQYLPDDVTAPTRNGASITLEHLSVQHSGLPRMPNNFKPKSALNPFADYSYEQLYEFLSDVELVSDVGEKYLYSNAGVGLLGHLLERATGEDYETLVVERIAKPLGMPDTCIALNVEQMERLASGHLGRRQVPNWDIPTLAGAGALRSTAKDMVTFLSANLGQTETDLREAMGESHQARAEAGGPNMDIGLGWHILKTNGPGPIVWHNGGTGGYRTFVGFVKETGKGVVVLTNTGGQGHDDLGLHLLDPSIPLRTSKEAD